MNIILGEKLTSMSDTDGKASVLQKKRRYANVSSYLKRLGVKAAEDPSQHKRIIDGLAYLLTETSEPSNIEDPEVRRPKGRPPIKRLQSSVEGNKRRRVGSNKCGKCGEEGHQTTCKK